MVQQRWPLIFLSAVLLVQDLHSPRAAYDIWATILLQTNVEIHWNIGILLRTVLDSNISWQSIFNLSQQPNSWTNVNCSYLIDITQGEMKTRRGVLTGYWRDPCVGRVRNCTYLLAKESLTGKKAPVLVTLSQGGWGGVNPMSPGKREKKSLFLTKWK